MSLMEHLQELRSRLFKASLGVVAGFIIGYWLSSPVTAWLQSPYCTLMANGARHKNGGQLPVNWQCAFVQPGVTDTFVLKMKIVVWVGLVVASPIWLYQLWAFIAPGLHRHERRYTYVFAAVATPLFAAGGV